MCGHLQPVKWAMWVHSKQPVLRKGPKDQKSYKNKSKEKHNRALKLSRVHLYELDWQGWKIKSVTCDRTLKFYFPYFLFAILMTMLIQVAENTVNVIPQPIECKIVTIHRAQNYFNHDHRACYEQSFEQWPAIKKIKKKLLIHAECGTWADFPHAVMWPDYTVRPLPTQTTLKSLNWNQPEHHRHDQSLYLTL